MLWSNRNEHVSWLLLKCVVQSSHRFGMHVSILEYHTSASCRECKLPVHSRRFDNVCVSGSNVVCGFMFMLPYHAQVVHR